MTWDAAENHRSEYLLFAAPAWDSISSSAMAVKPAVDLSPSSPMRTPLKILRTHLGILRQRGIDMPEGR